MGYILAGSFVAWWVGSDVVKFANEGNTAIFDDVFPNLRALYDGPVTTRTSAANWDAKTLHHEQFDFVQPLYLKQSSETVALLMKMSTGSGIYGATNVTNWYKQKQALQNEYQSLGR